MNTDEITYNQACGKVYQGGMPYISKIFNDEAEADDYLNHVCLHIRSSVGQNYCKNHGGAQLNYKLCPHYKDCPLLHQSNELTSPSK